MITCEQSFHNVFFSLHRTPEVHGCRAGPTELQNYNFTGFSVVKFQISWKAKEKDHWRQFPLKRYQLTVSCFDESCEIVSGPARLSFILLLNFGNLWMGRRGSLYLSLCPPCKDGAGWHFLPSQWSPGGWMSFCYKDVNYLKCEDCRELLLGHARLKYR